MVSTKEVVAANTAFATKQISGHVFVFTGATSGIGAATLEAVASMVDSATFYIAGRSSTRFSPLRTKLESLNPSIRIVFFECDVSLLASVAAFASLIISAETKIDYLCMSQGMLPFTGARYTSESLETCFSLSYFSRALLVARLLPLLRNSTTGNPRVLSILNGGKETTLNTADLGLARPGSWTPFSVIAQSTMMTTLSLGHLASQRGNEKVTFMHAFPGLVRTDIAAHMVAPPGAGWLQRIWVKVLRGVMGMVMFFVAVDVERAGERGAYLLVGAGGASREGGMLLVDEKSEVVTGPAKTLGRFRREGWGERVWEYTLGVVDDILTRT